MSTNPRPQLARIALLASMSAVVSPVLCAGSAADEVQVEGAYVRAVPPGQINSAAFMSLTNGGTADHALVAAESDASKVVELHTHREEDGMMKMRRVDRIDLPAGATVELAPGGLHVMLIDLARELSPGHQVRITLVFEDASATPLEVPVKTVRQTMGHEGHRGH